MVARRKGFTLIELLVVIAIIGILAAMLFPVFARARESARKIQCLANVKNIALAVNMYLVDYDAFWPKGKLPYDAQVTWELTDYPADVNCVSMVDPYLRPPVILDEYIKNRDVWRCPSAKTEVGAGWITPMPASGLWWDRFWGSANDSAQYGVTWGQNIGVDGAETLGPCKGDVYPPGWGGEITDSFLQGPTYGGVGHATSDLRSVGAFEESIGILETKDTQFTDPFRGKKESDYPDPSAAVVVADIGANCWWPNPFSTAYPDVCGCNALKTPCDDRGVCGFQWSPSPDESCCTYLPGSGETVDKSWVGDFRDGGPNSKSYTRHMGGVNLGFIDGHAKWWPSRSMLQASADGQLKGWCGDFAPFQGKCHP